MYKLKKYQKYILFEDVDDSVKEMDTKETSVEDNDSDMEFEKLLNIVNDVVTKPIKIYYNEYTLDGQKIDMENEYYSYGKYTLTDYKNQKNHIFLIKLDEKLDNGYSFKIIKSIDDDNLKDIDTKDVEIMSSDEKPSKFDKGQINGRYIVFNKEEINKLKPKNDTEQIVSTKENDKEVKPENKKELNINTDDIKIKDEETLKSQIEQLKNTINSIDDKIKLTTYLKKCIETQRKIENQISKLEKLPKNKMVLRSIKVLEIDLSLMDDLKTLITKKIS